MLHFAVLRKESDPNFRWVFGTPEKRYALPRAIMRSRGASFEKARAVPRADGARRLF